MPTQPIVFANIQQSGWEQLAGAPGPAINVVIDGRGTVRRRPAIQAHPSFDSSVIDSDGLSLIRHTLGGELYAVGGLTPNRSVYRVTTGSSVLDGTLAGSLRPQAAETEALVVLAGGSTVSKVDLTQTPRIVEVLGGSPPAASHVVANASRLLANDMLIDRSKVRYSDPALGTTDYSGHETWQFGGSGSSGFFTAEARPDPVVALGETTNEVFVWGSTNVQIYRSDGQTVFAPGATREYGCSAPYSPVKVDQAYAWLDHMRRIVVSDGRSFEVISKEIQQVLDDMATVSDCFGYRVHVGPVDCLAWCFPSDGRTLAYQRDGGWSTWMSREGSNWARFPVNCHHHSPELDDNLVGTTDGRIGRLVMAASDDLGTTIDASVETGFLDRGTDNRKWCKAVYITLERGQLSSEQTCQLRYADAPGQWSEPLEISLGVAGDTHPVIEFRSLGVYRRRAWKFTFSAATDLALASVREEFEVLEV